MASVIETASGASARAPSRRVLALLVGVTVIKILVAARFTGTIEVQQMLKQAQVFLAGQDFLDPGTMNGNPSFFPLGHYGLVAACLMIAEATGVPFAFLIKLPAILADLMIALLLHRLPRGGERAALFYVLNPVSFLLSAYHAQPHSVAVLGSVLACWLADQGRYVSSGLALGLAASIRQHFGILIVPLAIRAGARRKATLVSFVGVVVLLNVWLLASAHPHRVLAPTWTYGSWGYTMVLLQGPRVLSLLGVPELPWATSALSAVNTALELYGFRMYWLWAAVFLAWVIARSRKGTLDLWRATLVFLVGIYAISPGFGIQWLVWAVPFWLLVDRRDAISYSVLAGAFVAGSYWQWGLNLAYGVRSITANLALLRPVDLAGVMLVGLLGVLTWAFCVRATWRLARS